MQDVLLYMQSLMPEGTPGLVRRALDLAGAAAA